MEVDRVRLGLILAVFLGAYHAAWSLLVAVGLAQRLLDFVFWLHFLNNPLVVGGFGLGRAALLTAVTAAAGFLGGWLLAWLWNRAHKRDA